MSSVAELDLDLEVFQGPFDLLLTLVLKEEVDLLEVDLAEIVLAYVAELERAGELDLEATTEFLVLIAALLELKSRMMLPVEHEDELELAPGEAAEVVERERRRAAQQAADRLPEQARLIRLRSELERDAAQLLRQRRRAEAKARLGSEQLVEELGG